MYCELTDSTVVMWSARALASVCSPYSSVRLYSRGANGVGSSRILRGSPVVFVLSRNCAVTFWKILDQFAWFSTFLGKFWANFEHFLTTLISRYSVNGSDAQ